MRLGRWRWVAGKDDANSGFAVCTRIFSLRRYIVREPLDSFFIQFELPVALLFD